MTKPTKFTVLCTNSLTGTSRYRGMFETEDAAREYAEAEAKRSRSFAGFEVWTGTPGAPGKPTNIKIQGKH